MQDEEYNVQITWFQENDNTGFKNLNSSFKCIKKEDYYIKSRMVPKVP